VERVEIPMVPSSIQEMVVGQAVQVVVDELPKRLTKSQMARLTSALHGAADGISCEEREAIIDAIAGKLDSVPLLPMNMRQAMVGTIVDIILGDMTVGSFGGAVVGSAIVDTTASLISADGRKRLAVRIAEKVDLPGLSESQEVALFECGINALGSVLETLIPPEWRPALQGASAAEIDAFKTTVVATLSGRVAVPFISNEKKQEFLGAVVDFAFEGFLDTTGLDGVVLHPEAQLERLEATKQEAQEELEALRRQAARREASFQRRLARIEEQRVEIRKELGLSGSSLGLATYSAFAVLAAASAAGGLYFFVPRQP